MSRIVVMNHVTLDGVMQAPGRSDEDTRCGFTYGGWGQRSATADDVGRAMGERMAAGGGLGGWLFGRRTYEGLLSHWTQQPDSPFGPALSNSPKYVAASTLKEPLPWPNSTLLHGDLAFALSARAEGVLKAREREVGRGVKNSGRRLATPQPSPHFSLRGYDATLPGAVAAHRWPRPER